MAQESWKGRSGRPPAPEVSIEELLTEGYKAHEWMRTNSEFREPLARRYQKKRLALYLNRSRPAVNAYLQGGGVPFPFPAPEELVWVVNIDDKTVRWVSPSMCITLGRNDFIGRSAHEVLRGGQATEEGHSEALEALIRGELDFHECHTAFVRHPDHWLVPLNIRVSYGPLYRNWFGRGELAGQAFEPPSTNASKTRDHAIDVVRVDGQRGALEPFLDKLVEQLLHPSPAAN